MKRCTLPLLILTLAACARTPVPDDAVPPGLAPAVFGGPGLDRARVLAGHSAGVYVAGYTDDDLDGPNQGELDAFVRKYGASGDLLWAQQFGTSAYDYADGVAADPLGNVYVAGSTNGDLAGSSGAYDVFIRKIAPDGAVVWTRQFGSSAGDVVTGVAVSGENAVYVVGITSGDLAGSSGSYDAFIRRYDVAGNVIWTQQFGTAAADEAQDVAVDASGNAYVAGFTRGSLETANGGGADMFIRKYSADGIPLWTRQLHRSETDYGYGVAVAGRSVYLVGDVGVANSVDVNVQVVKYTAAGALEWRKGFGSKLYDHANDVSADGSGVAFAGATGGAFAGPNRGDFDGYVVKLAPDGQKLWATHQGTSHYDYTDAVLLRGAKEVYAAGGSFGRLGGADRGGGDAFLRRLKGANGATVWTDQ